MAKQQCDKHSQEIVDIRTEFRIGDFINFIRDTENIDYYYKQ